MITYTKEDNKTYQVTTTKVEVDVQAMKDELAMMLEHKEQGALVTRADIAFLLETSLQSAYTSVATASVTAQFGHFGGGERRKPR